MKKSSKEQAVITQKHTSIVATITTATKYWNLTSHVDFFYRTILY